MGAFGVLSSLAGLAERSGHTRCFGSKRQDVDRDRNGHSGTDAKGIIMRILRRIWNWLIARSFAEARARNDRAADELDAALREVLRR